MKKSSLILALALAASLSVLTASAQFTFSGTDTFSDGVISVGAGNRWTSVYGGATGSFGEDGNVLTYTSTTEGTKFQRWTGTNTYADNNFDNDWTASVSVTNTNSPGSGYVSAGIQIVTSWEGNGVNGSLPGSLYTNAYYSVMLVGGGVETEWTKYNDVTDAFNAPTRVHTAIGDSTDILLRLSWSSAANLLTAAYSTNAGATYFTAGTFDLAGAQAGYTDPYNQKFALDLFAGSGGGAGAITGGISFDNMSVSAIPEPSTYAAIAGLGALGLAFWRRRQARTAAQA